MVNIPVRCTVCGFPTGQVVDEDEYSTLTVTQHQCSNCIGIAADDGDEPEMVEREPVAYECECGSTDFRVSLRWGSPGDHYEHPFRVATHGDGDMPWIELDTAHIPHDLALTPYTEQVRCQECGQRHNVEYVNFDNIVHDE